jgi:hypothetical protein
MDAFIQSTGPTAVGGNNAHCLYYQASSVPELLTALTPGFRPAPGEKATVFALL